MGLDGKVEADRCLDSWSRQLVMVSEFSSGIFYISNRCAVFALTNLEDLFKRSFFYFYILRFRDWDFGFLFVFIIVLKNLVGNLVLPVLTRSSDVKIEKLIKTDFSRHSRVLFDRVWSLNLFHLTWFYVHHFHNTVSTVLLFNFYKSLL